MEQKQMLRYSVIILNYNTMDDSIAAAESVKKAAQTDEYLICIADNASKKENETARCSAYKSVHVVTHCLDRNLGYAVGNNSAIRFLKNNCESEYYVIMNPDVLVLEEGTIERMIERIEAQGSEVVGGQPLVWNCYYPKEAEYQQNIRRVPDFADMCMLSFLPLRLLMKKRYRAMTYSDEVPYRKEMRYSVPSGAFFIIRADVFEQIGLFDEGTFLYYEEHILGKRLENAGKQLLFMPQFKVRHEHGKSTGSTHFSVNTFAAKCSLESRLHYVRTYLNAGSWQCGLIWLLSKTDHVFQHLKVAMQRHT